MKQQVLDFLKKYDMHSDGVDLANACDAFIDEMKKGLAGQPSSMLMLPAYVGIRDTLKKNEKVIVLDAGGTNLRSACVHFDENDQAVIEGFRKMPMLGTQGELTKDAFFQGLADLIAPFDKESDCVGFCFSFPAESLPNGDAKMLRLTKQLRVTDLVGEVVGEGINEKLAAMGCTPKRFMIINDTVASLLGGAAANPDKDYDSYIGFILGTGTNTCYLEDNKNITKVADLPDGTMAINMESANFGGFTQGAMDKAFDATTKDPGMHTYEKMVSGAYQGHVILGVLKQAAADGLFTADTAAALLSQKEITMYDVDRFCEQTDGDNLLADLGKTEDDRETMFELIDDNFERAAKMVCVNLSAILLCTGKGKDAPVCISAEGTTFYKSVLFRPKLERYLQEFLVEKHGRRYEFVKAEDATLIGSAMAGLY